MFTSTQRKKPHKSLWKLEVKKSGKKFQHNFIKIRMVFPTASAYAISDKLTYAVLETA